MFVRRGAFAELRARVSQRAGPAGVAVPATAEGQASLSELEPLVVAVAQAEVGRTTAVRTPRVAPEDDKARVAALEAAVQRAIGVLNRVLGIHHQDDAAFQPLLECQAKASELRLKLSRVVSTSRDYPADRVDEAILPFADLMLWRPYMVVDYDHLIAAPASELRRIADHLQLPVSDDTTRAVKRYASEFVSIGFRHDRAGRAGGPC